MSIRIVLTRISHPGNIGSAARAMKTMGLERLCLVAPDILDRAQVFPDVRSAVADCGLVVGTTARSRHLPWRIVEPREAAGEIAAAAASSEVAVLFGAERTGLTNDEIELCQLLLTIPTGSSYGSLNVAMAVQVVAYEILLATRAAADDGERRGIPLASAV